MKRLFSSGLSGGKRKDTATSTSDQIGVQIGSTTPSSSSSRANTPIHVDESKRGFRASLRDRLGGTHSSKKYQQLTVVESNTTSEINTLPDKLEGTSQDTSLYSKRLDVNLPDDPNHQQKLDTIDYSIQVLGLFDELSEVVSLVMPDALGLALKTITAILEKLKVRFRLYSNYNQGLTTPNGSYRK